jgi:hypothetical protein
MSKNILNLLLLVLTFSTYYLFISPLYSGAGTIWQPERGITALKELNTQYDETLGQADTLNSQAKSLSDDYTNIPEDQKARMKIMVPDSVDKVRLLSEFDGILQTAGLTSKNLAVSDNPVAGERQGAVGITFSVRTTYPVFKNLMERIEKSMRLYSIQSVSFSAPEKESDLTEYTVRLETYYIKQ